MPEVRGREPRSRGGGVAPLLLLGGPLQDGPGQRQVPEEGMGWRMARSRAIRGPSWGRARLACGTDDVGEGRVGSSLRRFCALRIPAAEDALWSLAPPQATPGAPPWRFEKSAGAGAKEMSPRAGPCAVGASWCPGS